VTKILCLVQAISFKQGFPYISARQAVALKESYHFAGG
jgi:hypothetical protein